MWSISCFVLIFYLFFISTIKVKANKIHQNALNINDGHRRKLTLANAGKLDYPIRYYDKGFDLDNFALNKSVTRCARPQNQKKTILQLVFVVPDGVSSSELEDYIKKSFSQKFLGFLEKDKYYQYAVGLIEYINGAREDKCPPYGIDKFDPSYCNCPKAIKTKVGAAVNVAELFKHPRLPYKEGNEEYSYPLISINTCLKDARNPGDLSKDGRYSDKNRVLFVIFGDRPPGYYNDVDLKDPENSLPVTSAKIKTFKDILKKMNAGVVFISATKCFNEYLDLDDKLHGVLYHRVYDTKSSLISVLRETVREYAAVSIAGKPDFIYRAKTMNTISALPSIRTEFFEKYDFVFTLYMRPLQNNEEKLRMSVWEISDCLDKTLLLRHIVKFKYHGKFYVFASNGLKRLDGSTKDLDRVCWDIKSVKKTWTKTDGDFGKNFKIRDVLQLHGTNAKKKLIHIVYLIGYENAGVTAPPEIKALYNDSDKSNTLIFWFVEKEPVNPYRNTNNYLGNRDTYFIKLTESANQAFTEMIKTVDHSIIGLNRVVETNSGEAALKGFVPEMDNLMFMFPTNPSPTFYHLMIHLMKNKMRNVISLFANPQKVLRQPTIKFGVYPPADSILSGDYRSDDCLMKGSVSLMDHQNKWLDAYNNTKTKFITNVPVPYKNSVWIGEYYNLNQTFFVHSNKASSMWMATENCYKRLQSTKTIERTTNMIFFFTEALPDGDFLTTRSFVGIDTIIQHLWGHRVYLVIVTPKHLEMRWRNYANVGVPNDRFYVLGWEENTSFNKLFSTAVEVCKMNKFQDACYKF